MDEAEIHRILTRVLASGIATPGARLGEQSLADLFAISRDRMRRVLQRLGHERKLELVPNRGARTINPGLSDARAVYEARRILEGGIVLTVAERISDADLDQLGAQHEEEQAALRSGDTARVFQLGGALHMLLGEMAGNQIIVESLRNMVDRTSTLLTFFGPSDGPACSCREHGTIIAALQKRDPLKAREAMCSHLSLVETRLRTRPRCDAVDVETLIKAEIAKAGR
jgi:DNA-binding GntR family transcriptional regulator